MRSVSAHDAKARFGQLLDTARREPVVIERHGRAVAVVLSKEDYDELNEIKLQQLRAEIS
jgi:prevent-host-death family protein